MDQIPPPLASPNPATSSPQTPSYAGYNQPAQGPVVESPYGSVFPGTHPPAFPQTAPIETAGPPAWPAPSQTPLPMGPPPSMQPMPEAAPMAHPTQPWFPAPPVTQPESGIPPEVAPAPVAMPLPAPAAPEPPAPEPAPAAVAPVPPAPEPVPDEGSALPQTSQALADQALGKLGDENYTSEPVVNQTAAERPVDILNKGRLQNASGLLGAGVGASLRDIFGGGRSALFSVETREETLERDIAAVFDMAMGLAGRIAQLLRTTPQGRQRDTLKGLLCTRIDEFVATPMLAWAKDDGALAPSPDVDSPHAEATVKPAPAKKKRSGATRKRSAAKKRSSRRKTAADPQEPAHETPPSSE